MAKYSKKAQDKVAQVMHEMKKGKLKSGSGDKVTDRKQAIAIGLSEAREAGAKVPKKAASKKSARKNPATKKSASKKSVSKKSASRGPGRPAKPAAKKAAPRKKAAAGKRG